MEKLYTCTEVAERYHVQVSTVWEWIRTKKLNAIDTGRVYAIRENDLKAFEQENQTAACQRTDEST